MTTSKKKTMAHSREGHPTETTRLMPTNIHKQEKLSYMIVFFLMLNRSINLVMYKALTTFSYFFSEYFSMNYTLFAIVAVMNFPGNLLNIVFVPFYTNYRIKYVMIVFELILAASCALIVPFHILSGLLICRLMTGFAVTAVRTEVNATIGAFTEGERRTRSISIIEMSFALSSAGFLVVGSVLHFFGWKIFFLGTASIICLITLLIAAFLPPWYLTFETGSKEEEKNKNKKKAYSTKMLSECLQHKRLLAIFVAVLLNKISRNAFYYTFSKWLAQDYGMNVQQTGFVTLTMAAGHLCGSAISPPLVNFMGIYGACIMGALVQVGSMCVEPVYYYLGQSTPLFGACGVVFCYFCGCQLWYNNLLDICFSVTPRRNLFPAVQTILLACGSLGGSIGTIGSTFWYAWGNEVAIAGVCACCNSLIVGFIIMLYIHFRRTQKLLRSNKIEDQNRAKGKYINTPLQKEDKERVNDEFDASTMVIVTSNDILAQDTTFSNGRIIIKNPNGSINYNINNINNNLQNINDADRDFLSISSRGMKLSESLRARDTEQTEEAEDMILRANFNQLDIDFGPGITIESNWNWNWNGNASKFKYYGGISENTNEIASKNAKQVRSVSVQTSPIMTLWNGANRFLQKFENSLDANENEMDTQSCIKKNDKEDEKMERNEQNIEKIKKKRNSKDLKQQKKKRKENEITPRDASACDRSNELNALNASNVSNASSVSVTESSESKNEDIDTEDEAKTKGYNDNNRDPNETE